MDKIKLLGKTLTELQEIVLELGLPKFNAKQIAQWLYKHNASDIEEMTNLSKKTRERLAEKYEVGAYSHTNVQTSVDGTKKYLFPTIKDQFIESAYIPDRDRATLCVSSQVGCKMGCLFCMTARQGFMGHLTSGDIVNQVRSLPERENLTNIVYMGMGEPLDNLEEVLKSIEIFTSDYGYAMSPRRITLSTIGLVPAMQEFLDRSEAHLAISLHSPFEQERKQLMPIESVYSLHSVIDTVKKFDFGRQRRVSFEYIMFDGVNDSPRHARELIKLLGDMRCRVNLIKFHPIPDSPLKGCPREKMEAFENILKAKGVMTTIRSSRGEDIFAACGLLSTKEKLKKK